MQTVESWNAIILIKGLYDDTNLLNKQNLLRIDDMEKKLKELEDWPLFCKAMDANNESCSDSAISSPISYLY